MYIQPGILRVVGFGDCVDRLLLSGASVFSKDLNHNTALHYACEEGNVECAKLLLNAGKCHLFQRCTYSV